MTLGTFFLAIALTAATPLPTPQTAPAAPASAQPAGKRTPPKPASTAAAGGGADKVWVNTASSVYHCPGDRYYGKTKDGRYMAEKDAKAAGAKGPHGKTCFK